MSALFWTAAGVALLLAILYFLICALLVYKFLHREPDNSERFLDKLEQGGNHDHAETIRRERKWYPAQPKEDVWMESFDGLRLHGNLLEQPEGKNARGTLLLAHGFRGSGYVDFSCALRPYYELGFNLLVIDQRAHLQSEGEYITMGVRERRDVRDWALWLLQKYGEDHPVILDGISMGAASVLMASGLDLPKSVVGIIADCGFTSPREIFHSVMTSSIKLPTFLLWGADICCRIMAGFSIDGASTVEAIRDNRLPLLLIHGRADDFVPCWMTEKCAAAAVNCEKDVVLVEEAGHGLSFLVDRDRVYASLVKFLDKLCPKNYE